MDRLRPATALGDPASGEYGGTAGADARSPPGKPSSPMEKPAPSRRSIESSAAKLDTLLGG